MAGSHKSLGAPFIALVVCFACGDMAGLNKQSGAPPQIFVGSKTLAEDFDNRELIDRANNAVIDLNQGIVTLHAQSFPEVDGDGIHTVITSQNGLVQADTILVPYELQAPDSAELRANELVHVVGALSAGPGGISIYSKKKILIDGDVESEGPVHLLVAEPDGEIVINGRITTHATDASDPDITIQGRGTLVVNGVIQTTASMEGIAGDIEVSMYGGIDLVGAEARIGSDAHLGIKAGSIRIKSEENIQILEGARLGETNGVSHFGDESEPEGGDIELQAKRIIIDDDCVVAATGSSGRGGSIFLAASDLVRAESGSQLLAGYGEQGGSLIVNAKLINIGIASTVRGGDGATAGTVRLEAVQGLGLAPGSIVQGGTGTCAVGGSVVVHVGGELRADAGAIIQGGSSVGHQTCGALHQGGNVEIISRSETGLAEAVRGGRGATVGRIYINTDPSFTVAPPNLTVRTGGWIESITVDRGATAVGLVPRLIEVVAETPPSTEVHIQLSGSNFAQGPFDEWHDVAQNNALLEPLSAARYLRYRVSLKGRTFDAPNLDYFEIDLAPAY